MQSDERDKKKLSFSNLDLIESRLKNMGNWLKHRVSRRNPVNVSNISLVESLWEWKI